jgi:hypothetical protein
MPLYTRGDAGNCRRVTGVSTGRRTDGLIDGLTEGCMYVYRLMVDPARWHWWSAFPRASSQLNV